MKRMLFPLSPVAIADPILLDYPDGILPTTTAEETSPVVDALEALERDREEEARRQAEADAQAARDAEAERRRLDAQAARDAEADVHLAEPVACFGVKLFQLAAARTQNRITIKNKPGDRKAFRGNSPGEHVLAGILVHENHVIAAGDRVDTVSEQDQLGQSLALLYGLIYNYAATMDFTLPQLFIPETSYCFS